MIGAIIGDIVGSIYERAPIKTMDFPLFQPACRFTDDTVLTVAVAGAIVFGQSYQQALQALGRRYPHAGYGASFSNWLTQDAPRPYNSWGNGAAMRVSPVGWAFDTREQVLRQARLTAQISHNHPEGVKGAQATALAVFLARAGHDKASIKTQIADRFDYDLTRALDQIRPGYHFDVSCQGSVPEAIIAFLESESFEDAIRRAVSLGGDSDTLACITGAMAEAFYGGVPKPVWATAQQRLTPDLMAIVNAFCSRFGCGRMRRPSNGFP